MDLSLLIPAFIAGLLTFVAPCTLPLVPAFLGYLGGASLDDVRNPNATLQTRWKIFRGGLLYVLGFSMVFIFFGVIAGFGGRTIAHEREWFARAGGVFVILLGLAMMGAVKIPWLAREKRFHLPERFKQKTDLNAFLLGATFAFGWTPCIGPILGSILTLAAYSTTVTQGAVLLAVFSIGLGLPFLILAAGIQSAARFTKTLSRFLPIISFIGGAFLIFIGILLVMNRMGIWVSFFFRTFDFVNYDRILDYL